MDDLIRRSDVIGLLEDMLLFGEYDIIASSFSEADEEKAYRAINGIPAVNLWIPVEDALPENRVNVIFTINRGRPRIGCGYRIHSERGGLQLTRWFDKLSGLNFSDYDVKAWMPMPDAYKPPKEDDND